MRAIWKGAVAFGLVNVPVRLYAATGEHEVPLHQVHREDGGRIRYRRVCSACGQDVAYADIARGYEAPDGTMVVLTEEDLAGLPLATERAIEVLEFVPADQVDPILLAKTYYLEPEKAAAKPYALLREALAGADRMAVVKVALRQRESMAVLRVRDRVICLQTLLWPDEVRVADFPVLDADVTIRPQELAMASSLIDTMAADFDPSAFEDSYATALQEVIDARLAAGVSLPIPAPGEPASAGGGEIVDLLAALQRSVETVRAGRAGTSAAMPDEETSRTEPSAAHPAERGSASGSAAPAPAPTTEPEAEPDGAATSRDGEATQPGRAATKPARRRAS